MNKTELMIHPVRLRILQYISIYKEATTSEIITALPEVSKATIYNHIKLLENNDVIKVVNENRIRGTIEKTYAINEISKNNDFHAIMTFILSVLWDFQQYYEEKNNPEEDMLFAGRDCLLLTDEEFRQFMTDYENLCRKYMNRNQPDAKLRNVSMISSPAAGIGE